MSKPTEQWASDTELQEIPKRPLVSYRLRSDADGVVSWDAPDGYRYKLNPATAAPGADWLITYDVKGLPVMALKSTAPDGILILSLDGAPWKAATLMHSEDDSPRKYYFACDGGNGTPLKRKAFILQAEGVDTCPIGKNRLYRIMLIPGD